MFAGEGSSSDAGDGDPGAGAGEGPVESAAPLVFPGTECSVGLVEAARRVVALDPRGLSDEECLGVLDDVERAQRALEAARMSVLVAVDTRSVTDSRFGHRTANWVGARHGGPVGDVKRAIRDGRTLALHFPVLEDAVRRGVLSPVRAGVVCRHTTDRNVDGLAAAQDMILELSAAESSFRRFTDDVAALAEYADADGNELPPPAASRLSLSRTGDELHLRGLFTGELGVEVEHLLAHWANQLFRQHRVEEAFCPELGVPGRDQLHAEALGELLRRGHAADTAATRAPVVGITMTVTDADPATPWDTTPVWGTPRRVLGIGAIRFSTHTVDGLVCDPVIHPVTVDRDGTPLAVGRDHRFATPDQRRAAAVRDGGCVFPGCDAPPSWTDLHHVIHWHDDGPTEMWNLASLCRRHHGVVHRTGWTMTTVADQWFQFTTPTGLRLDSQRHRRPPAPA